MRRALAPAASVLVLAACGSPAPTNAPLVLRGAVSGVYHPGPPATCGQGQTMVMGQFGPDASKDVATMTVSDNGDISFVLYGGRGTFTGHGVSFRQGSGWDLDADLHGRAGTELTIKGHLSC